MSKKLYLIEFALIFLVFLSLFYSCKTGPSFKLYELTINPEEAHYGDQVTISVVIENIGDEEGTYEVVLKIDGTAKETKEIIVEALESKTISFTVDEGIGTHNVTIDELNGKFEVKSKSESDSKTVVEPEPEPEIQILTITTNWLPQANTGEDYECILEASGGSPPYTWEWDMPKIVEGTISNPRVNFGYKWSGISLKPEGIIYGKLHLTAQVPSIINHFSIEKPVIITVKDSEGNNTSKKLSFTFDYVR